MKVYLGADHRGFALKQQVADWLSAWDYESQDLGAFKLDPNDDYTDYAEKVAAQVAQEKEARGVLVCGSGVGVDIVANKFDGVRAGLAKDPDQVKAARSDDNINVLVLAADFTDVGQARKMLKVFLETEFEKTSGHQRRLQDIKKIEATN